MANIYDWKKIKAERQAGAGIKELALKYGRYEENHKKFGGVYAYFRRRLKDVKEDETVTRKIQEKLKNEFAEDAAKKEVELIKEYDKLNKYIRYNVANELRREGCSFERLKQLKISSEILANCKAMDWDIHLIKGKIKREKEKLELERMRLELEKIKTSGGSDEGLEALAEAIAKSAKALEGGDK